MEKKEKKEYLKPVLRTTEIKLGVFGSYGNDDNYRGHHRGRHGHNSGGWGLGD